jgi:hypothetical protein
MPRIRSERPAFDLHHPELAAVGAHTAPSAPIAPAAAATETIIVGESK